MTAAAAPASERKRVKRSSNDENKPLDSNVVPSTPSQTHKSQGFLNTDLTIREALILKAEEHITDYFTDMQMRIDRLQTKMAQEMERVAQLDPKIPQALETNNQYAVHIRILSGPYMNQDYVLEMNQLSASTCCIGRKNTKKFTPPRGLSLSEDDEVSSCHAMLSLNDGQVYLTDKDSTNGTIFNGQVMRPNEAVVLSPRSNQVTMGRTEFELDIIKT